MKLPIDSTGCGSAAVNVRSPKQGRVQKAERYDIPIRHCPPPAGLSPPLSYSPSSSSSSSVSSQVTQIAQRLKQQLQSAMGATTRSSERLSQPPSCLEERSNKPQAHPRLLSPSDWTLQKPTLHNLELLKKYLFFVSHEGVEVNLSQPREAEQQAMVHLDMPTHLDAAEIATHSGATLIESLVHQQPGASSETPQDTATPNSASGATASDRRGGRKQLKVIVSSSPETQRKRRTKTVNKRTRSTKHEHQHQQSQYEQAQPQPQPQSLQPPLQQHQHQYHQHTPQPHSQPQPQQQQQQQQQPQQQQQRRRRRSKASSNTSSTTSPTNNTSHRIQCICDLPHEEFGAMVQCDDCSCWLHLDCLKLNGNILEETFRCPPCYIDLGGNRDAKLISSLSWRFEAEVKSRCLATLSSDEDEDEDEVAFGSSSEPSLMNSVHDMDTMFGGPFDWSDALSEPPNSGQSESELSSPSEAQTPDHFDSEPFAFTSQVHPINVENQLLSRLASLRSNTVKDMFAPHASDVFLCENLVKNPVMEPSSPSAHFAPEAPPSSICSQVLTEFSFDCGPFWDSFP